MADDFAKAPLTGRIAMQRLLFRGAAEQGDGRRQLSLENTEDIAGEGPGRCK